MLGGIGVARLNPFSHAVELVRFALYGRLETTALLTTTVVAVVAMALAVAALIADGKTEIEGAECVEISYPAFFDHLEYLA